VNNWGAAFLPAAYQGTPLGNATVAASQATVQHIRNSRLTSAQQRAQLDLIGQMNQEHLSATGPNSALEGRLNSFELAFRMQMAMPEAQDISSESDATRKLYGLDHPVTENFGRQCLLARRFAERGVRFIQVTHSDGDVQWDQHGNLRKGHAKNAAEVDQPIAGLLRDLKSRGLLKDTLVVWGGEFGRTIYCQGGLSRENYGRDHHPRCFTVWMAGGGVKGGVVHGETDDFSYNIVKDPVHIRDLNATILHCMGIDHERLTYPFQGLNQKLTGTEPSRVVTEILA
jgi:hypothetical protein